MRSATLTCLAACLLSAVQPARARERAPDEVIRHHIDAFRRGDLRALLSDYAPDAVVVVPTGTFTGTAELRHMFEFFVDRKRWPAGATFEGSSESLGHGIELEHWMVSRGTPDQSEGTDIVAVRHGKIVFHTVQPAPMPIQSATRGRAMAEVMQHHLAAFRAGDLDEVLADYAPDAVLITPPGALAGPRSLDGGSGVYIGRDQIRQLFEFFSRDDMKSGNATLEATLQVLSSDTVLQRWMVLKGTPRQFSGVDLFVVREGQIRYQNLLPAATPP